MDPTYPGKEALFENATFIWGINPGHLEEAGSWVMILFPLGSVFSVLSGHINGTESVEGKKPSHL